MTVHVTLFRQIMYVTKQNPYSYKKDEAKANLLGNYV